MWRRSLFVLLAFAVNLSLHAGAPPTSSTAQQRQVQDAMAIPEELRQAVAGLELDRGGIPPLDRVRRLFEFMVAKDGLALQYQEQPTYDIAGSYTRRKVNCLSFSMMFVALARTVGVTAYAQASDDALAIRVVDDTLYRARHVKAGVDIEGAQYTVDVGWRSVVAERRPRRISDGQLVALLHNNNAVERLQHGARDVAAREISAALALDPGSATLWNNAGVIHWRAGLRDAAEQAYLHALTLDGDHVGTLGNLVGLYRATGATQLAGQYDKQLQRAQASDPFSQFLQAQELMRVGAYDVAASHYRRAIRLLPNQPEFHRSLADAYRKLGNDWAARRALRHAVSLEQRKYSQRGVPDAGSGAG